MIQNFLEWFHYIFNAGSCQVSIRTEKKQNPPQRTGVNFNLLSRIRIIQPRITVVNIANVSIKIKGIPFLGQNKTRIRNRCGRRET